MTRSLIILAALTTGAFAHAQSATNFNCAGTTADGNNIYIDLENGELKQQVSRWNSFAGSDEDEVRVLADGVKIRAGKDGVFEVVNVTGRVLINMKPIGPAERDAAATLADGTRLSCMTNRPLLQYQAPQSGAEFCAARKDASHALKFLRDPNNRLAFANGAYGLASGGVCWWHNRFERNAAFIAIYKPKAAKPNRAEALRLINALRAGKQLIEIPGYANLRAFSSDWSQEIIKTLEAWQLSESAFAWTKGLSGAPSVPAAQLKKMMSETAALLEKDKIPVFQILQVKGIVAHSILMLEMKKTARGYDLVYADSNYAGRSSRLSYVEGMTEITASYTGVPYTHQSYQKEGLALKALGTKYCQGR